MDGSWDGWELSETSLQVFEAPVRSGSCGLVLHSHTGLHLLYLRVFSLELIPFDSFIISVACTEFLQL